MFLRIATSAESIGEGGNSLLPQPQLPSADLYFVV
jgi:hypothetical protein